MDLIALKDFLVLCQVRSFSRAAERCHISVSGLSRRISGLEQWAGVPLFDRHKAALELTEAGYKLQAVASEVVYALDGYQKSVRADQNDLQVRIRFCAPHIMSAMFFPDWLPRLHADFKKAKFSVESDNLPECLALIDKGQADYLVALFDQGGVIAKRLGLALDGNSYLSLDLGRENLIPVSAPNAAGQPLFDLERNHAAPLSFLDYSDECHLGWPLHASLQAHELNLTRNHGATLADGLRFMAKSGLGLAWLPESLVRDDLAARRLVRTAGASFDIPLTFTLLRRPLPMGDQAQQLWEYLQKLAQTASCQNEIHLPSTSMA